MIELGIEIQNTLTKVEMINRIIQSEYYEDEIVKLVMEEVLEEKREKMEERRQIREFELERMRVTNITDRVSLSSEDLDGQGSGEFCTKAAIKLDGCIDDPYLLGNRTEELIQSSEQSIQLINAVETRSAGKTLLTEVRKETIAREQVDPPSVKLVSPSEEREEKKFEILPFEEGKKITLAQINDSEFKVEQKKCKDLKVLGNKARSGLDKEFKILNGKLVRVTRTERGEKIRQLCIPLKLKHEIRRLNHDEIRSI
ncbi:hypothetical protein NPIL_272631 [Nephila pilipes]|uniref:Uncharacterized protein n=1 Tax=Nephila pilipes TaxID=299642 RepID=A0A8X6TIJ9_NEPPI|nr:hypothetical protein NPIL_272631 [Nephila pilipes]